MKLKQYKKKTLGSHLVRELTIVLISIAAALMVINYFYKQFNRVMLPMAESMSRKYVMEVISSATKDVNIKNNLFSIQRNTDNEIKMIDYDAYEATQLINRITTNIENRFNNDEYIVSEIPFGIIFKNSILRNLGPMIKIKIKMIDSIISEIESLVKPYGINNALIEVRIKLKANVRVILPIVSKEITVTNVIPLSINIINGSIPEAYIATYK